MILFRQHKKLYGKKGYFCVQTTHLRRLFFLILFLIMITAFLLNMNPYSDFHRERLPGTILFSGVTIVLLFRSMYCWTLMYRFTDDFLTITRSLLFFRFSVHKIWLHEIKEIRAEHTVLLQKSQQPDKKFTFFSKMLFIENELVHLYFITDKKRHIDSSTNGEQITAMGQKIAGYLQTRYKDIEVKREGES